MSNDTEKSTERKVLGSYVTNHEFAGMRIPVPVQSLVLRDYASKNNLVFKLPVGEYFFPNCYVQLHGLLKNMSGLAGVAMCSLFMLPKEPADRMEIYGTFLRQGVALHCILESFVLRTEADIEIAEAIYAFQSTLERCPKVIPPELLPPLDGVDSFT